MTPGQEGMPVATIAPLTANASNAFELAFESLPSAALIFDNSLHITLRNQCARQLFSDDRFLPDVLSRLILDSGYEDWQAELHKVLDTCRERRLDVSVCSTPDAPETFLSIAISPLRMLASGDVVGGLLIADNVSSRIGMERRLAVSERLAAVGKLAARVAHELNNPLDGILRFTNLGLRRITDESSAQDPKIAEYLEQIRDGILRMRNIVSELLTFSRATPAPFEQGTINKIVEDALSTLEGRAQEANVTVVCNFESVGVPLVQGSSLFQIFCNLTKNAIDAMPVGGTLTISTRLVGPDLIITFEDTGVGLPADAERIFEPFFTTKPMGRGTGLGLAVCRELVEKYGGSISASRREPNGTVFTVSIPTHVSGAA